MASDTAVRTASEAAQFMQYFPYFAVVIRHPDYGTFFSRKQWPLASLYNNVPTMFDTFFLSR